jgi:hypothetical protein
VSIGEDVRLHDELVTHDPLDRKAPAVQFRHDASDRDALPPFRGHPLG